MKTTWKIQLEENSHLRELAIWPPIDMSQLTVPNRKLFLNRFKMIGQVLKGGKVYSISKKFNVSPPTIYRFLDRALSSNENHGPKLSIALVPHQRIVTPTRKLALPTLQNPLGSNCAFNYIIEHVAGLKEHLESHILAFVKDKSYGQNLTPKRLHSHLISYLKGQNWPNDCYPFTVVNQGYESARLYFHKRLLTLLQIKNSNRIVDKQILPLRLFEEIQMDEQVHDSEAAIAIEIRGVIQKIRISRCSLIILFERDTDYIYAHQLVLTKTPDQDDLLRVLYKLENLSEIQTLHSDFFEYPPAIKQIKSIGKQLSHCQIGTLSIDNAMTHHAKSIQQYIVERHKATLNFGLVKNPKRRNMLEYAFKRLNQTSHRLKSTTGSHVRDPNKESAKNRKKPPLIVFNDLEDIVAVDIANHNVTAQTQHLGQSPLERTQQKFHHEFTFFNASRSHQICRANERSQIVTLHSGTKERSLPYVNFNYAKYKILDPFILTKNTEQVLAIFNIDDIRTLRVTRLDGEVLGVFRVAKSWQAYPHTIKTRKRAVKLTRAGKLGKGKSLDKYFNYILNNKESPGSALELIRIFREYKIIDFKVEDTSIKTLPGPSTLYPKNSTKLKPWSIHDATQVK